MKPQELSHWNKNEFFSKFLLFVETIDESSFFYSFESYKQPALNCHYMCYDVGKTAHDIENKILMDGNFIPISEEFELMLSRDPYINTHISDNNILLFNKGKNDDYFDLSKQDLKYKIREYKEIAEYLINKCEVRFSYFDYLCYTIIDNVFSSDFSYTTNEMIYNLTRMFVTELVNSGYSQEFIQKTIQEFFFNSEHEIVCEKDTLIDFFNHFSYESFSYKFKFIVNYKMSKVFERLDNFTIDNLSPDELSELNSQKTKAKCVIIEIKDFDEFSAYRAALDVIQTVLSFHNLSQHNSKLYASLSAIVEKKSENDTISKSVIRNNINLLKKRGNTTYLHALYNDVLLLNKQHLPGSFYKAISLHNVAIDCKDISNQLLNLWTIIEVLIATKRDNEDRINTICSVLGSILNRNYMYSQMEQLLIDIKQCLNIDQLSIFDCFEEMDIDEIEKLTLLLALEKYAEEREQLRSRLNEFPLLLYRIDKFTNNVFRDSKSIYDYLYQHTKKIHWHIMRIYRNRNMIVHNGSYMPYRDLLVENLHFYVDSLLDTLIQYYCMEYQDNSSIYRDIICNETIYYQKLGVPIKNKKDKFNTIMLNEENALELIYNGFNGNYVKKAIDEIIHRNSIEGETEE